MTHFNRLMTDESGLSMVEYALLAALIAGVAVSTLTNVGAAINTIFGNLGTRLTTTGTAVSTGTAAAGAGSS